MNKSQNGKSRDLEKPIPGCSGRVVGLFELNTGMGGNRFLTDKPHRDGSQLSRGQSDVSRTSLVDDQMDDKVIVSGLKNSPSNRKSNVTPIKMLIAQEMSKEDGSKQSPPNLVAKLMGLDAFPEPHQPGSASRRSHLRGSRSHSRSLDLLQHDTRAQHDPEQGENKNVYETRQQSCKTDYVRDDLSQNGGYSECKNDKKTALVREEFMEAKRLSTDDKLSQSKKFQDALEVLCSNKDLFLKILQKPNSLFSQHLYNLQSVPPPNSRRITVLRPSNLVDGHMITGSEKKNDKQVKGALPMGRLKGRDKSSSVFLQSTECRKMDDRPTQPTHILVLKPSFENPQGNKAVASLPSSSRRTSNDDGYYGDSEDSEPLEAREVAEEISCESLLSSVLSDGYIGDGSSFSKSEIDYAAGDLSDSDVTSPTSRQSWEYINRFDSPYSIPSSRASPELSVCREAKKRLSERWSMMASNGSVQEQRHVRRSSSTLGEMLALSDLKKSMKSEEEYKNEEEPRGSTSYLISGLHKTENADSSPRNLLRSKSVPVSSTSSGSRLSVEVSDSLKSETYDTKDAKKEKSVKSSSFKGRVSSLFFSKNKKSSKERSHQCKDEPQSAGLPVHSPRNISNDGSQCISKTVVEEPCTGLHTSLRKASCQGSSNAGLKQGINLPETEFPIAKPETPGNPNENQGQPSPISVLEPQFEDDDHTTNYSSTAKPSEHGVEPMKCNLIGKSPPIGSLVRTLSWDDFAVGPATRYPGKSSTAPLSPEEEEHEYYFYVKTLLSATRLNSEVWHSPESPLDPSLRDKYMNTSEKESHDAKQRRRRVSIRKLVFDCINEALMDTVGRGPHSRVRVEDMTMSSTGLGDHVWTRMKEWVSGEERCVFGGDDGGGGMVVERVVRKEVGRGWVENLKLEFDDLRKEIEGKLLEELVQETVSEFFTG